jgi:hypothetical protein
MQKYFSWKLVGNSEVVGERGCAQNCFIEIEGGGLEPAASSA